MSFSNFKTYGDSPQDAFETFCTQLFERHLRRKYGSSLVKFRVINGAGGDGGLEAYGELANGDIIAVQAKWFPTNMEDGQIRQIKKSVETAIKIRKKITEYIICVPRALNSTKMGKGGIPVSNTEESRVDELTSAIQNSYPSTIFTWWFEQDMELELHESDNEGLHRYWFEKELISLRQLIRQFDMEKSAWIDKRYIPELHGTGLIQNHIEQLVFGKEHRQELLARLDESSKLLLTTSDLISRLSITLSENVPLRVELDTLRVTIEENLSALAPVIHAVHEGISPVPLAKFVKMPINEILLNDIRDISPSDRQLAVLRRLSDSLERLTNIDLVKIRTAVADDAAQHGRLFLGNSGTGKTHALSNTVDVRLNKAQAPAIIIRAKGAPSSDWTLLLRKAIDIDGWNKDEIMSALDTLAIRTDHMDAKLMPVGEELKKESTKVVICIDGLEEDTNHWPDWYERMREATGLAERYPRVRFAYTARPYFLEEKEVPKEIGFKVIHLPREGDIPVLRIIDTYFSPEQFNILVEPKSLIRGIDSLYALRLFCELYRDKTLTQASEILTAEKDLLHEKINRLEKEFRRIKDAGSSRTPLRDAIAAFSEVFFTEAEIEHHHLFTLLKDGALSYLGSDVIERVIEHLVNNGFLSKSEIPTGTGMLKKITISYTLTYQSIMELIMAEKYVERIAIGELSVIPAHLIAQATDDGEPESHLISERIVQQIVNGLFHNHGRFIGQHGFLTEGLHPAMVRQLQTRALAQAPKEVAMKFRDNIDGMFFQDYKTRFFVFNHLIFPSSDSSIGFFGAEYLHDILMGQPNAFVREKIWLGWDRADIHGLGTDEEKLYYRYDLKNVIDPYGEGDLILPEYALHNERPLVYAWALATLDQSLRERLRMSLTQWGLAQPQEFKLLLDKLFAVNDPQIREDLASITLGIASRLKDQQALKQLADWTLGHVFPNPGHEVNIMVRMGFRAIVEKAHIAGVVSALDVQRSRPAPVEKVNLLPLDAPTLKQGGEQIYPIVHDLAWYVVKRAFDDFLEYESVDLQTPGRLPTEQFLQKYLTVNGLKDLRTYEWAISSAIAYMKSLGFSRSETDGNGSTQASHGVKSKNFTLEEKYTWLAVHHLQAHLADHLPLKESGEFIQDYMKINSINNPAEFLSSAAALGLNAYEDNWLIKEPLAPEMGDGANPDEQIKLAVEADPVIDFENWIHFSDAELFDSGSQDELLALYNHTSVHDSRAFLNARIDLRGILIEKGQATSLLDIVQNHHGYSYFVEHIDRMVAMPDTDTYSNPSDIVWMQWIGEMEIGQIYYLPEEGEEKEMRYSVTSVTRDTVSGEEEVYIPSKKVRELLGINELINGIYVDDLGMVKAISHSLSGMRYDRQKMILVKKDEFLAKLDEDGLELVWFADLYRSKNALNDQIKSDKHPMRTRKYFVWYENGQVRAEKFWDARFSNARDNDPNEVEQEEDDQEWRRYLGGQYGLNDKGFDLDEYEEDPPATKD